jgi:hypothetical protein
MPKHVGVEIWNVLIKIYYFLEHLLVFLQIDASKFYHSLHIVFCGLKTWYLTVSKERSTNGVEQRGLKGIWN